MSDSIKHECGIALIRLRKPLQFYIDKYGSPLYALNKLSLLMEKQHNRGQDGAGIATIKLNMPPGHRYISRHRSNSSQPLKDIFEKVNSYFQGAGRSDMKNAQWLKENIPFTGEVLMGHLRYGTHGKNTIESCHPFLRQNNWMSRCLVLAGNFNLTNVDELFQQLVEIGQHPKEKSDTVTILEKIGHFLDEENKRLYRSYEQQEIPQNEISRLIAENLDIQTVLSRSAKDFDGGYTMGGLIGHGDAFLLRDPAGIRPAYFYEDDEVIVAASERPAIQTAFNVPYDSVKEVNPGHALIIKRSGDAGQFECRKPVEKKACTFERIYFSRGNDKDIYHERKKLGKLLTDAVLKEVDYDLENTVFSFIPNTAETAFYGLIKGVEDYLNDHKIKKIREGIQNDDIELQRLINFRPRVEKLATKDVKLRTFITEDVARDEMVAHVYDITYGTVRANIDTIVVVDDSIVRGTTLKQSIIKMLDRLSPKKIIVVSSAPQIRYPDCYGIDMSKMNDFIAFRAAIDLLHERKQEQLLNEIYDKCKEQSSLTSGNIENQVKRLYKPFTAEEISQKISENIRDKDVKAEVRVIYQSLENLHKACPDHKGDWYFSGDFPTPGGNKVVNRAFINFMEGKNERAY